MHRDHLTTTNEVQPLDVLKCHNCDEEFVNIEHPLRPGVIMQRRCGCSEGRVWFLQGALDFIRDLSDAVRAVGFDVALAGSVLKKGHSKKDIDIVLFPLRTDKMNHSRLHKALLSFGMTQLLDQTSVTLLWRKAGSDDCKRVEVWDYKGKRVDLFFLE